MSLLNSVPFAEGGEAIFAQSFFALLRKLGLDSRQLDLPQLLVEAEKADHELLQNATTTGFVELLRLLQQE